VAGCGFFFHPVDEDLSPGTPVIHPVDEDLSPGTPVIHPVDEDLSPGTPVMKKPLRSRASPYSNWRTAIASHLFATLGFTGSKFSVSGSPKVTVASTDCARPAETT